MTKIFIVLYCLILRVEYSDATVYTGVDTIRIFSLSGFNFSQNKVVDFDEDFSIQQLQTLSVSSRGSLVSSRSQLIDLGKIDFDKLHMVPEGLTFEEKGPPPSEGHVYILQTAENNWAKFRIEDIITRSELDPNGPYDNDEKQCEYCYIRLITFRWSYQDDGSTSFRLPTIARKTSYGIIKKFFLY